MKSIFKVSIAASFYFLLFGIRAQPAYSWAKGLGNSGYDSGLSVDIDFNGGVFTYGVFSGTVDINQGTGYMPLIAQGSQDIFIQKSDGSGNFIFGFQLACDTERCGKLVTDKTSSGFIVSGTFQGQPDMDPGPGNMIINSQNGAAFLLKLSAQGQYVWAKQFGSENFSDIELTALTCDDSSNLFVAGKYNDTIDIDPSATNLFLFPEDSNNTFLAKYDANGNLIWAKSIYGRKTVTITAVATDGRGNIVMTGMFADSVDFDSENNDVILYSGNEATDIFVCKLNADGNLIWVKSLGGKGNDAGYSIDVDKCENIYFCGTFQDSADIDPSEASQLLIADSLNDAAVVKFNSAGQLKWAKSFSGKGNDAATSLTVNINGEIYVSGYFEDSLHYGGNSSGALPSSGKKDVFLFKIDAAGLIICAGKIGGISSDSIGGMAISTKDHIFLAGSFQDSADFDPGSASAMLTSNGGTDIFICQFLPGTCCLPSEPPSLVFASPIEFCNGESSTLIAVPAQADGCPNFMWYSQTCGTNPVASGDTISVSPSQNMGYFVRTEGPCDTSTCKRVDVIVNPRAVAYFEYALNMNCIGPRFTLSNKSILADSYQWTFSDGTGSMLKNPTEHQFAYNSNIKITLLAKNAFGCNDTFSIVAQYSNFEDYYQLRIPNIFTPNNDGINDQFKINYQGDFSGCFNIKIFDRWGVIVFSSDDPQFTWDGKTNSGIKLPQGTYFYVIEIGEKKHRGFINLSE